MKAYKKDTILFGHRRSSVGICTEGGGNKESREGKDSHPLQHSPKAYTAAAEHGDRLLQVAFLDVDIHKGSLAWLG